MNQLSDRRFPPALFRISPVRDIAVKIFRDRDLRRPLAPVCRPFAVVLFKDDLAAVASNFSSAAFPFYHVEGRTFRVAEPSLEDQAGWSRSDIAADLSR